MYDPATPPSAQELKADCIAFGILTLSFFFFPCPPASCCPVPFPLQGLSHLMMSEQGRCPVLAELQPPEPLTRLSLWLVAQSLTVAGRPFAACPSGCGPGWQQDPPVVGRVDTFPDASWSPAPILCLASPSCSTICHLGHGPARPLPREKHETRHDVRSWG